jgi:hypothetical protein
MIKTNLKIQDYPADFMIRSNVNTSLYCDIALESYYDALQLYSALEAAEWHLSPSVDIKAPERLRKKIITAIVFSAMTTEAFVNDYLAVRLGDKVFKDFSSPNHHYYDKIKVMMSDILKQDEYKSSGWYAGITELFYRRNCLVHSTSKEMTAQQLVRSTHYEDWRSKMQAELKLKAAQEEFPDDQEAQFHAVVARQEQEEPRENHNPKVADLSKQVYLKEELENARLGLVALSDMTRAIEKLDPNSRAFMRTFSPLSLLWGEKDEMAIREIVFPNLGLNFTKEDLERVFIARSNYAQSKI